MAPGRVAGNSSPEYEKKKAAIGGVIDFNDANGIKFSRRKLFEHFGVHFTTGYQWFPPSGANGARRGRAKAENIKDAPRPLGLKRTRSEDPVHGDSPIKLETDQTSPPQRQNPIRNVGRDGKRPKQLVKDLTEQAPSAPTPQPPISPPSTADASSPPHQQLLTPPKGKRGRPCRQPAVNSGYQIENTETMDRVQGGEVNDDVLDEV